jgi:hypothetical protein
MKDKTTFIFLGWTEWAALRYSFRTVTPVLTWSCGWGVSLLVLASGGSVADSDAELVEVSLVIVVGRTSASGWVQFQRHLFWLHPMVCLVVST